MAAPTPDSFALSLDAARELARRTGIERHDLFVMLVSGRSHVTWLLPDGLHVPMVELPGERTQP